MGTFGPTSKVILSLNDETITASSEALDLSKGTFIEPSHKI